MTGSDTVPSRAAHIRFIGLLAMNINFMEENGSVSIVGVELSKK